MDENLCHYTIANPPDIVLKKNENLCRYTGTNPPDIIAKINDVLYRIDLIDSKLAEKYNEHALKITLFEKILSDSNRDHLGIIKNLI